MDTPGAGIAGVYDIGVHYDYEDGRGVAELSTMKRAMGGRKGFAAQSPVVILQHAINKHYGHASGGSKQDR